jgi:hypothetical protein
MAEAYGLRLTLGGAPDEPHAVEGVPGLFRPSVPTPVGGEGELSLEEAQKADANPSVPLELVKIAEADLAKVREAFGSALEAARGGIAELVRSGGPASGFEAGRVSDEQTAVAATTSEEG